ncbi:hepatic sodium/bile acid cotransporter-like isoform X2 [Tachypleus tridentatus]|uniref:hepatic sodium/bile acid cotransporter-like isoform X2 n=1 Tax=Tachypleus tridentatus TaxID=6853 RepID=UPI003FD68F29
MPLPEKYVHHATTTSEKASFGFGLLLFNDLTWRLGLFTLGCSPGGTMSNFWNIIFHGDVSLSVIMTFMSTIAALGFIPLWMSTLGSQMMPLGELSIPFEKLVTSLIGLTIPIGIGILIQRFKPRWADFSRKIIRPFTLICVAISLVSGVYSYYYVILLFNWRVVVAGMAVAWGGFFFGAIFSWFFRLSRPQVIAVAFETALQNASIAFIILQLSLPQPFADLAVVPLAAQLLMTGAPLYLLFAVYVLYHKFVKKDKNISSVFEDPEGGKPGTTNKEDNYSEERRPLINNRNRETVEPKEETTLNSSRRIENMETATLQSSGGKVNMGLENEATSHEDRRIVKNDTETEETFLRNTNNDSVVGEKLEIKS